MNNVQMYQPRPPGISPGAMQAQFNNQEAMALAQLDPRYQIKNNNLDRPGFSRSAGTFNAAGTRAAEAFANAMADTYGQQLDNTLYNANAELQGAANQENFAQGGGALQRQNAYADQLSRLQYQQQALGILQGLLS